MEQQNALNALVPFVSFASAIDKLRFLAGGQGSGLRYNTELPYKADLHQGGCVCQQVNEAGEREARSNLPIDLADFDCDLILIKVLQNVLRSHHHLFRILHFDFFRGSFSKLRVWHFDWHQEKS